MRRAHPEAIPVERLDDFGCENCLELLGIRVLVSQIMEHIPASAHHLQFLAFHRKIPFSLFKRSQRTSPLINTDDTIGEQKKKTITLTSLPTVIL